MNENLKDLLYNYDQIKIDVDGSFKFHCTQCGKCCINRDDIILSSRDIFNISKELQMSPLEMIKNYCEVYIGSSSKMPLVRIKPVGKVMRCPFLKQLKCSIHKSKPSVCALFPLGRVIKYQKDMAISSEAQPKTEYIFTNPECGDDKETHTVREWLNNFSIPLEDEFFLQWSTLISELSQVFCELESLVDTAFMTVIWSATLVRLYLSYDLDEPFLPQFKKNVEKLYEIKNSLDDFCAQH